MEHRIVRSIRTPRINRIARMLIDMRLDMALGMALDIATGEGITRESAEGQRPSPTLHRAYIQKWRPDH